MQQSLSVPVDNAVKQRRPYKKIPLDHKLAVVRATFEPGMSVSRVARRFDVNANLVFRWRRMYGDQMPMKTPPPPATFVPVEIMKPVAASVKLPAFAIECDGGIRIRIDAGLDEAALARVITAVRSCQ